jgi:hypothetical protein
MPVQAKRNVSSPLSLCLALAATVVLGSCKSADPAPSSEEMPGPDESGGAGGHASGGKAGGGKGGGGAGGEKTGAGGLPNGAGGGPSIEDAAAPADDATPSDDVAPAPDDGGGTGTPDGGSVLPDAASIPGCKLMWNPSAMRDGEKAFELAEMPDVQLPGGSVGTHQGVKHITAVADHDAYRIDSHYAPPGAVDYDRVTLTGPTRTDRLRCETRGMVGPAGEVDLLNGQTWRLAWSFFVPSSLKGTSRFTHIMQMKYVDKGGGSSGSPIITVTLRPNDTMEVLFWIGGGTISTVSLAGLHDKWLSADMTVKIAPSGSIHWVLTDGSKVIADKEQAGTTWPSDGARLRPKWGIYRGVADGVQSTYILLSDFRAYQCQ